MTLDQTNTRVRLERSTGGPLAGIPIVNTWACGRSLRYDAKWETLIGGRTRGDFAMLCHGAGGTRRAVAPGGAGIIGLPGSNRSAVQVSGGTLELPCLDSPVPRAMTY